MNLLKKANELYEMGFAVLPTLSTKAPVDKNWQQLVGDNRPVPNGNFEQDGIVGIGIVLGHKYGDGYLHCLDVDCYANDISRAMLAFIMDRLGESYPYRVGQAPKFAVPVLMDAPTRKMTSAHYGEHHIEFLGLGQQFVAYGEHPQAKGGQYKWHKGDLGVVPTLTMDDLSAIMAHFEQLCEKAGLERTGGGVTSSSGEALSDLEQAVAERPLDLKTKGVKHYLNQLPAQGMHYDEWLQVGAALHHQYQGGDKGYEIWGGWSMLSDKHDPAHMRKRYDSFGRGAHRPLTMATIIKKANDLSTRKFKQVDGAWLLPDTSSRLQAGSRINWLVEGIIEQATIGQIFAAPGVGKTFLALDMAAHIAAGVPWNDRRMVSGPVVVLAGEGIMGINRRLAALELEKGIDTSNVIVSRMPNFGDAEQLNALLKELQAMPVPPVMVIVDTLARATAGLDENVAKDMGPVVESMAVFTRKLGCVVMAIHHTPKASGREARGSGAIKGAMDFEIRLEKEGSDIRVSCAKSKDAEPFDDMAFQLISVQLPENHTDNFGGRAGSAVVRWIDVSEVEAVVNLSDIEANVMQSFESVWADTARRCTTPQAVMRKYGLDAPAEGVPVDLVRSHYEAAVQHEGMDERKFKNRWDGALRRIRNKGVIETYDGIVVKTGGTRARP